MRSSRLGRALLAASLLAAPAACRHAADPDPLVGTFLATTFRITPSGQGPVNVLAQGGVLGVNFAPVAGGYVTAGTLIVPATLNGGVTFTASLAGTATRTESTVRLAHAADTFVRNLTFTLAGDSLTANQMLSGTTYDLVLRRQ
jgi:hypothetical protein